MEGIDFWRLCDELSVVQAALLLLGHDPALHENQVENWTNKKQPTGYSAAKTAILGAIKNKLIDGELGFYEHDHHHEPEVSPSLSTVKVDGLKKWMRNRGFDYHLFFFPEGAEGEFLNKGHHRYSPKLAAAVKAWKALDDEHLLNGKTPKSAAQIWLRLNAVEFNLCDDDGRPIESAIEEISKVINWSPKGGAPATPTTQDENKKPAQTKGFSLKNPTPLETIEVEANCDPDGVPF